MDPASHPPGAADQQPPFGAPRAWSPPDVAAPPAGPPTATARIGTIVLAAVITQLVVIGAACNQWVTVRVVRSIQTENDHFAADFKTALITFNWRFTRERFDNQHILLGQLLMILTTVVISAALIAIVVGGPVTFVRAFFGCWTAVIVATGVGGYVRGLVNDAVPHSYGSRLTRAMFGPLGPTSITFLAGILLGLIVGLVAAIVAVSTRRAVPVAGPVEPEAGPYGAPEQPPPYYGESPSLPPWQEQRYGPPGRHAASAADAEAGQPTTQLPPPPPDPAGATTQLPALPRDEPAGDQLTTRFPRPPDDDDLPHG